MGGSVGMIVRISLRGKGPFRGNTHECGVLQDLLISTAAVSEHSVCGTPVGSKVRKDVQTAPRRIKISSAGMCGEHVGTMVILEGIPRTCMLGRFPDVLRVSPP